MRPAQRRAAAGWVRERFALSERRACRLAGIGRSTMRYQRKRRSDEGVLRQRLRQLAAERPRFGYRRLHALLRREGTVVNHKRVARLYREEGLAVRKRKRRRVARDGRGRPTRPTRPNQQWGVDFLGDALAWGRQIRLLTVEDTFTREALAIEVDISLPGRRVAQVLDRVAGERGAPEELVLDNGPELTGQALDRWASEQGARLRFIDPGKPVQNAFVESFHGRLRDECLNQHWFLGLTDGRCIVEAWRDDYNRTRPHSALGYRTPEEFRRELGAPGPRLATTSWLSRTLGERRVGSGRVLGEAGAGQAARSTCLRSSSNLARPYAWSQRRGTSIGQTRGRPCGPHGTALAL